MEKERNDEITYLLPGVSIYPQNRWGDIARSQGLTTARNWRNVKEGTTKGINDFANSDYMQFALAVLPLPAGIEGTEAAISTIKSSLKPIKLAVRKSVHIPEYKYSKEEINKLNLRVHKAIEQGVLKPSEPKKIDLGEYNVVDRGEYYNPIWQSFYDDIMKPLDTSGKSVLPKRKPRMVLGKKDADWKGLSFDDTKDSYVNLYGGDINTGVHEYVSHGTDGFTNPRDWEYAYYGSKTPEVKRLPWLELRATLNEARFNIYRKSGAKNLEDFYKSVDTMNNGEILDASLYSNFDKLDYLKPVSYNGYADEIDEYLRQYPEVLNTVANKLRNQLKYIFGLAGVGLYDNKSSNL